MVGIIGTHTKILKRELEYSLILGPKLRRDRSLLSTQIAGDDECHVTRHGLSHSEMDGEESSVMSETD